MYFLDTSALVKRHVTEPGSDQVRRLLRHLDRAEVASLRIPNPNSFRACDEEISFAVNLDAVRDSVMLAARFLAEYAAVGEASVGNNIVDADVALGGVVHIEALAIGRKC